MSTIPRSTTDCDDDEVDEDPFVADDTTIIDDELLDLRELFDDWLLEVLDQVDRLLGVWDEVDEFMTV